MTGTEISVVMWGVSNAALLAAAFFKLKSDVRHLNDTKEDKDGLGKLVSEIHSDVRLANKKLDDHGELFDLLPCLKPGCKNEDGAR